MIYSKMTLDEVLGRLPGARRCRSGWVAKCPAHPDHRPSLSIGCGDDGKALLNCFAGCDYRAIVDALGGRPWTRPSRSSIIPPTIIDDAKRTELARRIWREAEPAARTLVETYLRRRAITIPIPPSLRFHSNLRHPTGTYLPAMVGGVQDCGGAIVGVHRTYLRPDGSGKAEAEPSKMMLGPCSGGAVQLAEAFETLIIGEGIETCLSAMQATGLPTWAALSTSGLTAVRLPAVVKTVFLAIDYDASGAGDAAAMRACDRFLAMGLGVRIARPARAGTDFNDMLRE